jgi:hypothetical protein
MTQVKLELDTETFGRLVESAIAERRPADWQAEVILMRALGVPPRETHPVTSINPTPAVSVVESRTDETSRVSA